MSLRERSRGSISIAIQYKPIYLRDTCTAIHILRIFDNDVGVYFCALCDMKDVSASE